MAAASAAALRELCVEVFMILRRHNNQIVLLLEILAVGCDHLPCFQGDSRIVIDELCRRFQLQLHDAAARDFARGLIEKSLDNWTTTCYDKYQRCCVGII